MNEDLHIETKNMRYILKEIYDWVESAVTALIFVMCVFTFLGMSISVNGESMEPTLQTMDRLICIRNTRLEYKDIVVVTNPHLENNPLIKRVIATSGQTIDFDTDNRTVVVDGVALTEPYIAERMSSSFARGGLEYPLTIPDGHIFVMGDNRNYSWDSRIAAVGPVDERYVLGKVVYRILPYRNMGRPS